MSYFINGLHQCTVPPLQRDGGNHQLAANVKEKCEKAVCYIIYFNYCL